MKLLKLPVHFRPRDHYQLKMAKQSALNIKYLAQLNHIRVTEMTRILFRAGLKAEANIDFSKYKSVKELQEAMKKDKPRPQDKIKQTISIKIAREERTVIRIDQILHAAIKEFGEQRGLKAHESGFIILRAGFRHELLRPDELKNLVIKPIKSRKDLTQLFERLRWKTTGEGWENNLDIEKERQDIWDEIRKEQPPSS